MARFAPMAAYAFAIFTGAFLLFQVQPLMGRYVLPWFGGAPGVWTTCMLFFQVLLLGGYAYAHLSSRLLKPRAQVLLHLALLALALATLPITPSDSWKPTTADNPTLRIIALLAVSLGLPYFVLSATAPLLQHWFSRAHPGRSPYRLYALSNTGSLLALLSYPAFFESLFTRTAQARLWGAGLFLYAAGCAWCGYQVWKAGNAPRQPVPDATADRRPTAMQKIFWLVLPACASVLLLAITNKICQDVAVIAFLWVLPLSVYLLSFIICFDRPAWYRRSWFGWALAVVLALMGLSLSGQLALSVPSQVLLYTIGLFVCCMVCHGEVYRLKPDPAHLTSFYLLISAGGALGGVFVAVIAPLLFTGYFELHWGLVLCGALFVVLLARDPATPRFHWPGLPLALSFVALIALGGVLWTDAHRFDRVRVYRSRDFYGVLTVNRHEYSDPALSQVELMHGRIAHGMEFLAPDRILQPTLYFSPESGVGRAFQALAPTPRRVGVVGLGAGTLAAYARPGDQFRFYEINAEVEKVARRWFRFLQDCPGAVQVVLGDARLSLEREAPQHFDLLVLDAFSSDAIPIHLLTREAIGVYERHLNPDGVIAVHVSNMSLDLEPVVLRLAQSAGFQAAVIEQPETSFERGVLPSIWVLLSRNAAFIQAAPVRNAARPAATLSSTGPLWTDDFSGLFPVLRWSHFFGTDAPKTLGYAQASAILAKRGEVEKAIAGFREDLRRDPNSAAALNNLACLLAIASDATLRNGSEAVQLAEKACTLTQNRNPVMVSTLAAAYAECGRFDEAVTAAEKACALAEAAGQQTLARRSRELIELYRRKQPYHQPAQ